MQDSDRYFRKMMTDYMTKKAASVQLHHVRQCGTQELKFEVASKDRARRGMRRQTPVNNCILNFDGTYCCSCIRPKLLYIPCSHEMAACADIGYPVDIHVSYYFRKETITSTWQYEIYGFRMVGSFTETANPVIYIFQTREQLGLKEGAVRHGVFVMTWMSQSSVRGYSAAVHVIRVDTRINVVQIIILGLVLLKLVLQVMLQMEDLQLHQGVADVADRVLL
jgi:hypothetical protein